MYLDMNEGYPDVTRSEKDLDKLDKRINELLKTIGYSGTYADWLAEPKKDISGQYSISEDDVLKIVAELEDLKHDREILVEEIGKGHNYIFVGKASAFCPMLPGSGGGWLMRKKDEKYDAVTGTKDQRWLESETVQMMHAEDRIDRSYFDKLVDEAVKDISVYGDIEMFRSIDEGG